MRPLIALATVASIVGLTTVNADGPKKEDVPKNIDILKTSTSAKARAQAAGDLGRCGAIRASYVEDGIAPLLSALKSDKDADVRRACAKALGDIGTKAEVCVEALTEALKDSSVNVKIAAAIALSQFGTDAKPALPALRDLAKAKDDKKLSQAANAAAKAISGLGKKN
jgi:HEAT repeat protein